MHGVKGFGTFTKHVTLLPDELEKISLFHLFKELFTTNISKSNLLQHNIPTEKEDKHLHKYWIIISIIAQKILNDIAPYLKNLGSIIETFLNGNTIKKDDEGFISFLGHCDTRVKLDEDVKHGDPRYYPSLSMMASKLAYENQLVIQKNISCHLKMEYMNFYNCYNAYEKAKTTQAFMMREKGDKIIVAFRGTSPFDADDWITDVDYSWCSIKGMGKIHKGFLIALGLPEFVREGKDVTGDYRGEFPKQTHEQNPEKQGAYYIIRDQLKKIIASNESANFIVTGHSLGGALAILFPALLALHGEVELLNKLEAIYTFGQPRVGDEHFGIFMKRKLKEHNIKYYRIVYGHDIVPWLPFDNTMMTFMHFGPSIHFNSLYHGKIVEEEQIKPVRKQTLLMSYLGMVREIAALIIWCMVGRLKAVWELIRGFLIGFTAGPYYREGWLQTLARAIGTFLPEVVNHCPQDYLNSTLLASPDLFKYYPALN